MFSDHMIRTCVLNEEIPNILQYCHVAVYGGHFRGHKIATKVLQSGYYWLSILKMLMSLLNSITGAKEQKTSLKCMNATNQHLGS